MKFVSREITVMTFHKTKSGKFIGCVALEGELTDELIEHAKTKFNLPPVALDISFTATHMFKQKD